MADISAVGTDIGLLANHDIIDQARGLGIVSRKPRHFDARHVLLKPLQQRHEIPDRKDVIFHESPEIGDRNEVRVNRVVEQRRAKGAKVIIVVFRHVLMLRVQGGDLRGGHRRFGARSAVPTENAGRTGASQSLRI